MPKVKTQAVVKRSQGPGPSQGVASLGPGNVIMRPPTGKKQKSGGLIPQVSVEGRRSDFIAMLEDPVHNEPAMPPVSLPARGIPFKLYQEVLLTTDASGNAACSVYPNVAGHYRTAATWSGGNTVATWNTIQGQSENVNFQANFMHIIPLCYEVVTKYTGSMTSVSGRFYGIVGPAGDYTLTNWPREPNGCETIVSEGSSCTWYSTDPVWSNPIASGQNTCASEWMDCETCVGIMGGPVSATNCVIVAIYSHYVGFPKSGIVGLTPLVSIPDPNAAMVAALMRADESGHFASATSAKKRSGKNRKLKGLVRDALKIGNKVVGNVYPQLGGAMEAAEALALMLL